NKGQQIRSDGDAQRNAIFAKAFGRDAKFFAFYRSMQAYEKGLNAGDTRMLISPDSDFFNYFKDPDGAAP
ncbi:MAG: protease modulator HflC, partial [Alphaproteobacteria bacterium]|nr:protease modulator HflC [Alphaproteobacteria bacterium]